MFYAPSCHGDEIKRGLHLRGMNLLMLSYIVIFELIYPNKDHMYLISFKPSTLEFEYLVRSKWNIYPINLNLSQIIN